MGRTALLMTACMLAAVPARAGCPMELAVYEDRDGLAGIDFRPAGKSAAVTNSFRMVLKDGLELDGLVMWTEGERRARGMLSHDCPEGDVTGEELAACTLWEGVIYTTDDQGNIGLLPPDGQDAPKRLILADLGPSLRFSPAFAKAGLEKAPWDVFELSGCQE